MSAAEKRETLLPVSVCDGCNVREPFEHRCHGANGPIRVMDEEVAAGCPCAECRGAEEWMRQRERARSGE